MFAGGSNVRPLSWETRIKIMIGAARGLAFLHSLENKIIYRDLKPSNILLDKVIKYLNVIEYSLINFTYHAAARLVLC